MSAQDLYSSLKKGTIKKSQLSNDEVKQVYQYMIDSNKISPSSIKPEVKQKLNIQEPQVLKNGMFTEAPKFNTPTTNYSAPKPSTNYAPSTYQPTKSANPQNELADLLSNLDLGKRYGSDINISSTSKPQKEQTTWQTNPIKSAAANTWAGIGDLGRGFANVVDMTLGDKNIPIVNKYLDTIKQDVSVEDKKLEKINQGNVGQFAGGVFRGIGQSIPSVAIGLASAPLAAANPLLTSSGTQLVGNAAQLANPTLTLSAQQALTSIAKNPNLAPAMIQSVGNQYEQAINSGATKDQAIKSALLGGIPSGLIEVTGGLDTLASKLSSKMSIGKMTLESGLGEALEEILQYPIENLGQKATYDKDMPYFSMTENAVINPKQQLYNGATAFVSSALMGGAGGAVNSVVNKIADNKQSKTYNQQIMNLQSGLDEDLNTLYSGIENNNIVGDNLGENIEATKQILEVTKKAYPELTDFFDNHINKLDEYKSRAIVQPQTNENIEVEQTLNDTPNFAQNPINDVTSNIAEISTQPIENVSNLETQQPQAIEIAPQTESQIINEPINQENIMQEIAQQPAIENQQEEMQSIAENKDMNNYTEEGQAQSQDNIIQKLSEDFVIDESVKNDVSDLFNTVVKSIDNNQIDIQSMKKLVSNIADSNPQVSSTEIENVLYDMFIDSAGKEIQEDVKKEKTEVKQTNPKTTATQSYSGEQSFNGKNAPTNSTVVDMSRPLKSVTDIKNDIRKSFKISISDKTNKFAKRKALGYYKVLPEVIRTKYNNQLGTIVHELGHHLDKKYKFNTINTSLINDMINKLDDKFKKAYKAQELPGEVVAEFLRYYTTDTQTAQEFGGKFYDLFESTLSKQDIRNIQAIRSDALRWVNAKQDEKALSTIISISKTKKSAFKKISEVLNFEKVNITLADKFAPLQRFADIVEKTTGRKLNESINPHILAERLYKNDSLIEGVIRGKLINPKYENIDSATESLQKIVDSVGNDLGMFELYLKRKHALTLKNQGHQVFSNEIELTQNIIDTMEQQHPNFKEQSEKIYKWYDSFFKAWVIDTNMLGKDSKQIYKSMREQYPYYVPMFRVKGTLEGSKTGKTAKQSLNDQKSPVDRLSEKGNDMDTIAPIDGIVMQVSRMVNAYTKNNVMRSIVNNYNTVDGLGGFIDRVKPDMEKKMLSTQQIKDKLESNFEGELDLDTLESIIDSIDDVLIGYNALGYSKDNNVITMIAEDGSRQFYEVFDVDFFNSLTDMNPTQLDFTVKVIGSIRRTTTALTTGLNPVFGIAVNAPKDFLEGYIFGSYINPVEYGYEYVKSLGKTLFHTENYKNFRDVGGVYGSSMTSELRMHNEFIKKLEKYRKGRTGPKNVLSHVTEAILDFNDAIESAPRLTEFNKAYKIAKRQGKSEQNSMLYALSKSDDVTLNFSRKGTIVNTAVGQTIPYLNAGLQGVDKLRRNLITDKEVRTQTWIKAITMLTIPTILLWMYHKDDDDYEKLSKGIKDNYWILNKNADGSFIRIPKPRGLSAIFSSSFERGMNSYFKEQGKEAFEGFQTTIADALLPPVDTIFRPLIDVGRNKKWSGGKIVSASMENLSKESQYDDTTSRIGIILAHGVGKVLKNSLYASPKNVDYVLDQYWGGIADYLLPLTTPNSYSAAEFIRRKFVADPSFSNDIVDKFYNLKDMTTKANNSYEKNNDFTKDVDFAAEKEFAAYYKAISAYWKSIDYIGTLNDKEISNEQINIFGNLIQSSRFADNKKDRVISDLKDKKLDKESITLLQKTIRDEIINLSDKAVNEYKGYHKENNEHYETLIKSKESEQ